MLMIVRKQQLVRLCKAREQ